MEPRTLKVGDVVQISPHQQNSFFPACFMVVTETKRFGAQGYILCPKTRTEPPGRAFFRCRFADMEYIGRAEWVPQEYIDRENEAEEQES